MTRPSNTTKGKETGSTCRIIIGKKKSCFWVKGHGALWLAIRVAILCVTHKKFAKTCFSEKHFATMHREFTLKCNVKVVAGKHRVRLCQLSWFYLEAGRMPFAIRAPPSSRTMWVCVKNRPEPPTCTQGASLLEIVIFCTNPGRLQFSVFLLTVKLQPTNQTGGV